MSTDKHTGRTAAVVGTAAAAVVASLTSLAPSADAQDLDAAKPKPTVVLVHGAFADASGWTETAARLRHQGFKVRAVANPLRGLDYDTAYLQGLLKGIKGPKILVGHSYGGAVITNAATAIPDVKALVYVAAFAPDKGETLGGLLEQHPDPSVPPLPQQAFQFTRPDGTTGTEVMLDPAKFADAFAADVPAKTAALMAASQRPIAAEAFGQPAKHAAWKTIPSWALVAKKDHAIAPSLERFMAKRADAHITEVNSSHAVMVSHPDVVGDVINRAYRATR
ncbi:alpha/beta fold hydrolase [Streptomyces flavofungini]|uniref:Alpha/beta hydrolase n=1 Tax=Streptomyces flavofungini TaxID=68200 RepID=A0ABS0X4E9_9ACTN|nr:alpha/beta hydrolase [Streptomyces flavofungini]MBJ3808057.1 alpha/beta hydrolase [Streptomyces flavofungini]GHC83196.1 alpha/beta hydrolase [Streptomyces flavofungini]